MGGAIHGPRGTGRAEQTSEIVPSSHPEPAASSRASPVGLGAEQALSGVLGGTPCLGLGVLCLCVWCVRLSLGAVCPCGGCPHVSVCSGVWHVRGSFLFVCLYCLSEILPTVHLPPPPPPTVHLVQVWSVVMVLELQLD